MKSGYVVMNDSNYGNEIFGVYKSEKKAEKLLRKVIRNRFGHCPRDLDLSKLYESGEMDGHDSYQIVYFEEDEG